MTERTQRDSAEDLPTATHPVALGHRTQDMTISERTTTGGDPPVVGGHAPWRPGRSMAALVGVVAMGLVIGIAELVAAFGQWIGVFGAASSPLNSLGQTFIRFTPEWLKEFAIRTFGANDKLALTAGMGVTLILVAALIGIIGRDRPRIAAGIAGVLVLVTAAAILSRAGAGVVDVAPILLGGAAGIWFLVTVFRHQLAPAEVIEPGSAAPIESAPIESAPIESAPIESAPIEFAPIQAAPMEATSVSDPADNPKPATTGAAHPMRPGSTGYTSRSGGGSSRRQFFKLAGIGALVAAGAGVITRWIPSSAEVAASRARVTLPTAADVQKAANVDLNIPGLTPFVTDNGQFYRVDTAFAVPRLTTDAWQLRIHGAVDKEITLTYADLVAMPSIERMVTLTCVSNEVGGNLAGNARWQGVRISDVLKSAGPRSGADCVLSTSIDGFTVTTPLEALTDDRDAMLAFGMNGEALPVEHGFPVRMVVPGLYGYVSATKWVVDLNVTTFAEQSAYWTDRGWSAQAPIKTASRIDVPAGFAQVTKGKVAVAGVAWAQHRGITGVQVQVDDGPWQDATLSGEVSTDTWRQWSYAWDATNTGPHTLRCRATDGTGAVQVDTVQGVMPDGATGWDSRSVTVVA